MTHQLKDDENAVPISSSSEGLGILGMDTENCVHQQWLLPPPTPPPPQRQRHHPKLKLDFFRPVKP